LRRSLIYTIPSIFARKFFSQEYFFRQNFHCFYTLKQLPPINSRRMEFWLIPSLGIGRK
jgi:hypothetical protein